MTPARAVVVASVAVAAAAAAVAVAAASAAAKITLGRIQRATTKRLGHSSRTLTPERKLEKKASNPLPTSNKERIFANEVEVTPRAEKAASAVEAALVAVEAAAVASVAAAAAKITMGTNN